MTLKSGDATYSALNFEENLIIEEHKIAKFFVDWFYKFVGEIHGNSPHSSYVTAIVYQMLFCMAAFLLIVFIVALFLFFCKHMIKLINWLMGWMDQESAESKKMTNILKMLENIQMTRKEPEENSNK